MFHKVYALFVPIIAAAVLGVLLTACSPSTPTAAPTQAPKVEESTPTSAPVENMPPVESASTADAASVTATCTKLNLNDLTEAQLLDTIPNFSNRMVREFQEYRPYVSIQQFRREIGKYVDDAQVTEWEQYVYVPVDPNNADADTLKQLPGVDDTVAASLIEGRPYDSTQAFLDALDTSVTPDQLAQAACFLAAAS